MRGRNLLRESLSLNCTTDKYALALWLVHLKWRTPNIMLSLCLSLHQMMSKLIQPWRDMGICYFCQLQFMLLLNLLFKRQCRFTFFQIVICKYFSTYFGFWFSYTCRHIVVKCVFNTCIISSQNVSFSPSVWLWIFRTMPLRLLTVPNRLHRNKYQYDSLPSIETCSKPFLTFNSTLEAIV